MFFFLSFFLARDTMFFFFFAHLTWSAPASWSVAWEAAASVSCRSSFSFLRTSTREEGEEPPAPAPPEEDGRGAAARAATTGDFAFEWWCKGVVGVVVDADERDDERTTLACLIFSLALFLSCFYLAVHSRSAKEESAAVLFSRSEREKREN